MSGLWVSGSGPQGPRPTPTRASQTKLKMGDSTLPAEQLGCCIQAARQQKVPWEDTSGYAGLADTYSPSVNKGSRRETGAWPFEGHPSTPHHRC